MKKILLLLLLAFTSTAYSQESIADLFKSKERRAAEAAVQKRREVSEQTQKDLPKSNIDWAGFYLQKSARMQYGAIGCATASTALFVSSTFMKDKFELNNKTGEVKSKTNGARNAVIVGGGVSLIAAIVCEFCSIHYKMKSGDRLRLQAAKSGAGLALVF